MRRAKLFIVLLGVMLLGMQTVQAKTVVMEKLNFSSYAAQNGDTLTGTLTGKRYQIMIAKDATVTLLNLTINGSYNFISDDKQWAGITCLGNATIVLVGKNKITPFGDKYPSIWIKKDYTLTIQGDGSLEAMHLENFHDYGGAGIGGGREHPCGNILIKGGNITAYGINGGAGIGGGLGSSCGRITITGGNVTAKGTYSYGAGIGSGRESSCDEIEISGGTVNAIGGSGGAGIGSGYIGSCVEIRIKKGAHVTATKGEDALCSIGKGEKGTCTNGVIINEYLYKDGIKDSPYRYPAWDGNLSTLTGDDLETYTTATDGMTIYGELTKNAKVRIAAGATVTLDNVTIYGYSSKSCPWAGLTCLGNATIRLKGTNNIRGFYSDYPGIYVPREYTLTIEEADGGGWLYVTCNNTSDYGHGAGIGGAREDFGGNVIIHGGTINAFGGEGGGAGIGAGHKGTIGNITIDGGTVTATGGKSAAGIGAAYEAYCGNITITNGVTQVVAKRADDAQCSIGKGSVNSMVGKITVGGIEFPDGTKEKTFIYPPVCERPTTPQGITYTNAAVITWTAPSDQKKWTVCYHERSKPEAIKEIECTKTTCSLNALQPETEYVVWVVASCAMNTSVSTEKITIKTQPEPCNDPTYPKVSDVTSNSAVLSWTPGGDNQKAWRIALAKSADGIYTYLFSSTSPSYTLTDLEENTEYIVKITGLCGTRESDAVTTYFTTDINCKAVNKADVVVADITQTRARVAWYAADGEKEWWVYLYSDVATYRGFRVYDSPFIEFNDLKPGHQYRLRIKAVCDETHSSELTGFIDFETEPEPCEKVKNLTSSEVTENSAKITWERNGDNQDSYNLKYYKVSDFDDKTSIDEITGTSYTLTGLEDGTQYQIVVNANCGDVLGSQSIHTFTTEEYLCRTPRNFRVLGTSTATEIKLLWELSRIAEKDFELSWKKASEADYGAAQAVNGQTYTITTEAGTTYDIRIRTVCADGYSEYVTIQHTTPAAAPSCKAPKNLVRYGNATYNSFTISWTAGDEADTQWQVAYKAADDEDYTLLTATEKPFTISGLEPETEYTVQVRTVCGEDEYSYWSASRTITTQVPPCGAPSTPVVVGDPTYNSATITWTAGSDYQKQWKVYYKASSEADYRTPIEVDEPTYTFTDLTPSTTYTVQILGICGSKESTKSGSTSFTTAAKEPDCKKVSNVHVVGEAGSEDVTIGWTAGGDEIEWLVEYELSTDEDKFTEITTTYNPVKITGLNPSTAYFVRVRALCGELGEGEPASANFTTAAPKPCVAPTVEVVYVSSSDAGVHITPGTADQKQWIVQWKRTDEAGTYTAVTEYLEQQLTDLDDNTEYEVWAYAVCDDKNSDLSAKVTFTTKKECRAPKNVEVTDIAGTSAFVTWTEGDYDQTKFTVYYEKYGSGIWKTIDVASTHCLLTGLDPETEYHLQVRVACSDGSGWSDMVNFTTEGPCEVPTNVKINDLTHESATITWDAGATAQYWMVDVVDASTDYLVVPGLSYTNSLAVDGLEPETEYGVRLFAVCDITTRSDYSAAVYFTTTAAPVCAVPTNGKASNITAHEATITWTAGGSETKWYVIYDNDEGTLGGSELVTATTFELTGLEPKTHYTVNIMAECGPDFYSGWSDMIEFTTEEEVVPCMAPTALKLVSDASEHAAELTWTVNQAGQSKWILEYRSEYEMAFHPVDVTALPFTLDGLQANTFYTVRVKADCGGDFSEYSSEAWFRTLPEKVVCPVPTDVKAAKVYNNSALITWTAGDEKQKEWWIEYKTTDADIYTHFQTVYETQVMLNELDPETEYSFRVQAYYSGVVSDYAYASFTTAAATPCETPLGVKLAGPASQHYAIVTWTVYDDRPDSWVLDYRSEYESSFHSVEIVTPPYTLDGLEMNTRYDLRLKARCGDSFSEYTRVASFWTPTPDATCADPTDLQVSDVTASSAFITWTAGEEAQTNWFVSYRRTDGVGYNYGQMVFDKPEITLIGLDGAAEYEVSVTGICTIESGTISTTFTTLTPVCNAPTDAYLAMMREEGPVIFWTPAARQTSFNVYYKKASEAAFTNSVTVSDNACTLTGLDYVTDYDVQVTGLCGAVESDPSNIVSFTMPAEPTGPACVPPTSISVTDIYPTNVRINWTVESLDYMEWEVIYKVKGSSATPLSKHISGQQFTMLTGLEPETEYEVSVYTYCDDHLSNESVTTSFTTAATPCPNPTNIHVPELTTTTALVMWNPGSSDNLYWSVYYYPTSTPDEITIMDAYDGPSYLLTDLTANTEYGVRMLSFCDGEIGPGFTTPVIFCTMNETTTGVEEFNASTPEVVKFLKDGHIYIFRDGKIYDVMGRVVR